MSEEHSQQHLSDKEDSNSSEIGADTVEERTSGKGTAYTDGSEGSINTNEEAAGWELEPYSREAVIERGGGDPEVWKQLPSDKKAESMFLADSLLKLKQGEHGDDVMARMMLMLGYAEQEGPIDDTEERRSKIMREKPMLSLVDKFVLSKVKNKEKWKRVGGMLKIDDIFLKEFQTKFHDDDDEAYYSMLDHWLDRDQDVSWKSLLDVVGQFETENTVKDIMDDLLIELCPKDENPEPSAWKQFKALPQPAIVTTQPLASQPGETGGTRVGQFYVKHDPPEEKPPIPALMPESEPTTPLPVIERDPELTEDRLLQLVGKHIGARWKEFAENLNVDRNTIDAVYNQNLANTTNSFIEVMGKWLRCEYGTGELSRTWKTVSEAARLSGFPNVVEDMKEALSKEGTTTNKVPPPVTPKPSWLDQYKKAIEKQGSVSLHIIQCVLVGPPKVGKSCLKHLLVRNEPKEVTTSTPVLESPEIITFTPTDSELYIASNDSSSSVWSRVSDDDMEGIVKDCIKEEHYDSISSAQHKADRTTSSSPNPHKPRDNPISSTTPNTGIVNKPSAAGKPPTSAASLSLNKAKSDLLGHLPSQSSMFQLKDVTLIHVLDSGGQPAFQDTLPLLINSPCTFIGIFNASLDLEEEIPLLYRSQDGREADLDYKLSQGEMMLRMFSSVHTMQCKCHGGIQQLVVDGCDLPQTSIAAVGTHKDKLDSHPGKEELKKKINTYFDNITHSKPYRLLSDDINRHPYFLVDNLTPNDPKYLNHLRMSLSNKENALHLSVPLTWLIVQFVTQRADQKFVSAKELRDFCVREQFVDVEDADSQFRSLLLVLHNLGFYVFYELEGVSQADNWVCTDATALYKEISKLLIVQYLGNPKKDATRMFKNTGLVSAKGNNLKDLFSELDILPEVDSDWFLSVLVHIGLAACGNYGGNHHFFIPLALPFGRAHLPARTGTSRICFTLEFTDQSNPFVKHRETDLPRGIFPRLVVHLAGKHAQTLGEEKWSINAFNSDRTHIKFDCQKSAIYLVECACHIEVAIIWSKPFFSSAATREERQTKAHSFCKNVYKTLLGAINSTCEEVLGSQFSHKATVKCGFLCSCGSDSHHLALLESEDCIQCSIGVQRVPRELDPRESIWTCDNWQGSDIEFSLCEDGCDMFWVMEKAAKTAPPIQEETVVDQSASIDGSPETLDFYDKKPTDIAISDVADMLQDKAFKLAIKLGVPFAVVKPLKKEEDGGMEALYLWLNGETKPPTPTTWRFFLETVKKITGSEQAEEIEQMAMEDPTWSESPS
jgi:GTPase SAR1 family protein